MIKTNRGVIALVLLSLFYLKGYSQDFSREYMRALQTADDLFYFEENFSEAAVAYSSLLKEYPKSNNLAYKLGVCYLNIPGKKLEALNLLKVAVTNVVKNDAEYLEYGFKSPTETQFYLAHAFHINDSLDQAIFHYNTAKKKLGSSSAFRVDYINNQIKACNNAISQLAKPAEVGFDYLFPWLIEFSQSDNPVISRNDSVFIFTTGTGETTRVMCSYNNGGWQKPVEITTQFGKYANFIPNSMNHNGTMLILNKTTETEGDLFYSVRSGKTWSKARSMGSGINSNYWESFGFLIPEGNRIYFTSNRPGGIGELDIWVSDRDQKGNWGEPKNLGRPVNSALNETTPFFDPTGNKLWFSSIGHDGIGDYDLYYSVLSNGRWSKPTSMPYPVNTTGADLHIIPYKGSTDFINARFTPRDESFNIYHLKMDVDESGGWLAAKGRISLTDGALPDPTQLVVEIIGGDDDRIGEKIIPDKNGDYTTSLKNEGTIIKVSHEGYTSDTIIVQPQHPGNALILNVDLIPEKVTSGEFLVLKSILFNFDSFTISDEGKLELEKLRALLSENPSLRLELTGYTDSKGTWAYNMRLAARRVSAVVEYFRTREIPSHRFEIKAAGATDFVAENTMPDGSDNPEGRRYNRRVTMGVINPGTGLVIRQPIYTPSHLRASHTERLSIVILQSQEKYYPDYFRAMEIQEFSFVRPVATDSSYYYLFGDFTDYDVALNALDFARKNGFPDSYIINQFDLTVVKKNQKPFGQGLSSISEAPIYTIQLLASKSASVRFPGKLSGVIIVECTDGLFRYIYGEYKGFSLARNALNEVTNAGFKDAFIREIKSINVVTSQHRGSE